MCHPHMKKHSSLLQRHRKKFMILAHRPAPDIPSWATLPRSTGARSTGARATGQDSLNVPLPARSDLANNPLFMKCFNKNQF